jgi:hypothetical protein
VRLIGVRRMPLCSRHLIFVPISGLRLIQLQTFWNLDSIRYKWSMSRTLHEQRSENYYCLRRDMHSKATVNRSIDTKTAQDNQTQNGVNRQGRCWLELQLTLAFPSRILILTVTRTRFNSYELRQRALTFGERLVQKMRLGLHDDGPGWACARGKNDRRTYARRL